MEEERGEVVHPTEIAVEPQFPAGPVELGDELDEEVLRLDGEVETSGLAEGEAGELEASAAIVADPLVLDLA
ncbi:hypothetical protein QR680_005070 [Steinernema hermaphroditum]|uniref:Uncharacterized protein n=1 Tax=Steinernema hermaphroditum TaxID=289476 RepID=A0AA39HQR8_9BILA|nr:hypothetical protein QR680_005070 [Steinernema hermaphroditum]